MISVAMTSPAAPFINAVGEPAGHISLSRISSAVRRDQPDDLWPALVLAATQDAQECSHFSHSWRFAFRMIGIDGPRLA
jgi:hypothetical protein